MKKLLGYLGLASVVLTGNAMASVAEADCRTGSYGAGITVKFDGGKCVADINSNGSDYKSALNLPAEGSVLVDSVHYFRKDAVTSKPQTVVFPFSVNNCSMSSLKALGELSRIYVNTQKKWTAEISKLNGSVAAYTPYVYEFSETTNDKLGQINFGGAGCSISFDKPNGTPITSFQSTAKDNNGLVGKWQFIGTTDEKTWDADDPTVGSDGVTYGFAAKIVSMGNGVSYVGQFVKAGPSASVPPLRAYLVFKPEGGLSKAATFAAMSNVDVASILPNEIDIEYVAAQADDDDLLPETPAEDACFVNPAPGEDGYQSITIKTLNGKKVACIDDGREGNRFADVSVPAGTGIVDSIVFNRSFNVSSYNGKGVSTIVLPFSVQKKCIENADFYTFAYIQNNGSPENPVWNVYADANKKTDVIEANKPYFITANNNEMKFVASNECQYDFSSFGSASSYDFQNWHFVGTYNKIEWNEGNAQIGSVYGFSAKATGKVEAGQFIKVGAGASIPPLRAYLVFEKRSLLKASAMDDVLTPVELPNSINVIFRDADGVAVQAIGGMNIRTGVISLDDRWFDMKGRELKGRPSIKGNYYHNGHLVTIK